MADSDPENWSDPDSDVENPLEAEFEFSDEEDDPGDFDRQRIINLFMINNWIYNLFTKF